ncbi:MAG: alpha/beta hydrolase [Anaerolineae bacterium]|nr:alpha/beta hydrolase [Anaerolineae bacterium]
MRRLNRRWLLLIPVILLLALGGFVVWASSTPAPMPEALVALVTDDPANVETGSVLQFMPKPASATVGLIFYPGGKVDPRSYAPMAHALAARGYLVVIPPMPLNLAVFGIHAADGVIAAHPEIEHWALGGHSLGGSMAARYTQAHPDTVRGLALLASYPDIDLSTYALDVVVLYGSNDGLATVEKVESARALLPATAQFVEIAGGNHAQFGWYGDQSGDNAATISREAQQAQTIDAVAALLARLGQ